MTLFLYCERFRWKSFRYNLTLLTAARAPGSPIRKAAVAARGHTEPRAGDDGSRDARDHLPSRPPAGPAHRAPHPGKNFFLTISGITNREHLFKKNEFLLEIRRGARDVSFWNNVRKYCRWTPWSFLNPLYAPGPYGPPQQRADSGVAWTPDAPLTTDGASEGPLTYSGKRAGSLLLTWTALTPRDLPRGLRPVLFGGETGTFCGDSLRCVVSPL